MEHSRIGTNKPFDTTDFIQKVDNAIAAASIMSGIRLHEETDLAKVIDVCGTRHEIQSFDPNRHNPHQSEPVLRIEKEKDSRVIDGLVKKPHTFSGIVHPSQLQEAVVQLILPEGLPLEYVVQNINLMLGSNITEKDFSTSPYGETSEGKVNIQIPLGKIISKSRDAGAAVGV